MAPTYNESTEFTTYGTDVEPDNVDEVESGKVELQATVSEPEPEPVEEPAPKPKTRRKRPSRAQVRKIRGGSVKKDGEDYSETGKVYSVSNDVAAWLLALTDGYGRHYFESA